MNNKGGSKTLPNAVDALPWDWRKAFDLAISGVRLMPGSDYVVYREDEKTLVRPLSNTTVIGRSKAADIQLHDNTVSRQHAVIRQEASGTLCIEDLQSLNGVYANGDKVIPGLCTAVEDGAEVIIGRNKFRVVRDAEEARFASRISSVSEGLLRKLAAEPNMLDQIKPRQFEEVMAELYSREGFTVELTPRTRDGGVDLYVVRHTSLGRRLTIVDCKQYREDRPVGVGIVRQLVGAMKDKNADSGLIASTSFYTAGARDFQARYPLDLALHDRLDLKRLLKRAFP